MVPSLAKPVLGFHTTDEICTDFKNVVDKIYKIDDLQPIMYGNKLEYSVEKQWHSISEEVFEENQGHERSPLKRSSCKKQALHFMQKSLEHVFH